MHNKRACKGRKGKNAERKKYESSYSDFLPIQSLIESPASLQFCSNLNIFMQSSNIKLTKIVCTIGPATQEIDMLCQLMNAGMDIARLNFSHGTHEYHFNTISNIRSACEKTFGHSSFPIALDTKGPEIRTGLIENKGNECMLEKDSIVTVTTDISSKEKVSDKLIYVDYVKIAKVVKTGSVILIDDGNIALTVQNIDTSNDTITCQVTCGGILKSQKGVNLPGVPVDLPAVTEKDKEDLVFGVTNEVDFVFASFIRDAAGIKAIRSILDGASHHGKNVKIIAKLENEQGLINADEIINEADGIMVARGDMGVEIDPEKVFIAQRMLIAKCQYQGKPVICATQMLDSMTHNPRPTRAEVSDVAFAVADGSDAVMLSGETANGQYPIETVQMQVRIAKMAESTFPYISRLLTTFDQYQLEATNAIALSAVHCSFTCRAIAIVALTTNGNSVSLLSRYRPRCPIVCVTRNEITARYMALLRSCYVKLISEHEKLCSYTDDVEMRINIGLKYVIESFLQMKDTGVSLNQMATNKVQTTANHSSPSLHNVVVVTGAKPNLGYVNVLRVMVVSNDMQL
ncbi:hypothetical protein GJ496_007576 [Pomphorhynchus laevis]|nr:hypothetical protein GJ496_007576 [Pomphorhynchus laevis]